MHCNDITDRGTGRLLTSTIRWQISVSLDINVSISVAYRSLHSVTRFSASSRSPVSASVREWLLDDGWCELSLFADCCLYQIMRVSMQDFRHIEANAYITHAIYQSANNFSRIQNENLHFTESDSARYWQTISCMLYFDFCCMAHHNQVIQINFLKANSNWLSCRSYELRGCSQEHKQ